MTIEQYWRIINAAELAGNKFAASVLYCLYCYDHPNAPRKQP